VTSNGNPPKTEASLRLIPNEGSLSMQYLAGSTHMRDSTASLPDSIHLDGVALDGPIPADVVRFIEFGAQVSC